MRTRSLWTIPFLAACMLFASAGIAAAGTMPITDIPLDGTPQLRDLPAPAQRAGADTMGLGSLSPADYLHDGRPADYVLTLYDMSSTPRGPHTVPFWKEASGAHSDIYVAWDDLTAPAKSSQQYQTITRGDIDYMKAEFDTRIWASDVFHFGNYAARPAGTDAGKRAGIFIYNIRDDAYWSSYRFYIAGYFSSGLNNELDINAIFIDSYDWPNRTRATGRRPYLYEGTIAHEFEHLIHSDVDNGEDSFIDEGMADLAEQFIYGTATTGGHIGEYLYYHRDSLIDWKGELFDYGNAVLWQDYLWERAGGDELAATPGGDPLAGRVAPAFQGGGKEFLNDRDKFTDSGDRFIWDLIHDDAHGLTGVANHVGGMAQVEQLHRDYTLANLLDGKVSEPRYNYRNLVLGGADSDGYSIDDGIAYYESNVNGNMPPTRKNVRRRTVAEPWGAYYRTFGGAAPGFTLSFSGPAQDGVMPHSAPTEWYSGLGNMLDRTVSRTFTGVTASDSLAFWTWFDIEEDWDYGYVEARNPGGAWQVLAQTSALRTGATDINGSTAWKGAGGFTGNSGGWKPAAFSFGGLTGDVEVRFRYVTDEAANGVGWYVDDLAVGATTDPVSSSAGWANDGWLFTNGLQNNDWTVDVWVPYAKARDASRSLETMVPVAGVGTSGSIWVDTQYMKSDKVYAILGNRPDGVFGSTGRLTILKGR